MVLTATSTLADAGNASRAATFSFTLILKSECWDSTLTAPAMPSLTYSTILYDSQEIIFQSFSADITAGCGDFTYKLFVGPYKANEADEVEVATNVYTIDFVTDPLNPKISGTPASINPWVDDSPHSWYVQGQQGTYNKVHYQIFTNNIVDPCETTTISDQTLSPMTTSVKLGAPSGSSV